MKNCLTPKDIEEIISNLLEWMVHSHPGFRVDKKPNWASINNHTGKFSEDVLLLLFYIEHNFFFFFNFPPTLLVLLQFQRKRKGAPVLNAWHGNMWLAQSAFSLILESNQSAQDHISMVVYLGRQEDQWAQALLLWGSVSWVWHLHPSSEEI